MLPHTRRQAQCSRPLNAACCLLLRSRPCMYFTVLRDPVERAISEYEYFCVREFVHCLSLTFHCLFTAFP